MTQPTIRSSMRLGAAVALVTVLAAIGVAAAPAAPAVAAPSAGMSISPSEEVDRGEAVTFDGSGSEGAVEWVWDFGDGGQAVGEVVTHRYRHGGAYTVQLLTRDESGAWAKEWREVRVRPYVEGKVLEPVEISSGGAMLRGTVTRPDAAGPFPTILEYGPYGAGAVSESNWNRTLIRSGYAYVKVAMPGRWHSDGEFDMFGEATARGGCDTVDWIAEQPWSDGQVAMVGFSGPAVAATATLAGCDSEHLVTAAIKGAFSDFYRDEVHVGGTVNSNTFVNAWNGLFYAELATSPSQENAATTPTDAVWVTKAAADMNGRTTYDDWWRDRTYTGEPLDVPVLYYGTHRDLWPRAAPELLRWVAPAGGRVSLIYGGHGPIDPTGFNVAMHTGSGGYGEVATGETRAWLDAHMRDIHNGSTGRAPLSLLVPDDADWAAARGYRWLGLTNWPDPATDWQPLHLTADGALTEEPATSGSTSALGGAGWGATGSAEVDGLQQVVFRTAPLEEDLTVAGPVALELHAALDGADAAWNVQLEQVLPDGSVRQVNDGALQASHRALDEDTTRRTATGEIIQPVHPHTLGSVTPVEPGAVTRYDVEIPAVFNTFTAGSRIQLRITTNDARPVLDGHATAPLSPRFVVHHGPDSPSRLLLPAIREPGRLALPLPYHLPETAQTPEAP